MTDSEENEESTAYMLNSAAETEPGLSDDGLSDETTGPTTSGNFGKGVRRNNSFIRKQAHHYNDVNLSNLQLTSIPIHYHQRTSAYCPSMIKSLALHHNNIAHLQPSISLFANLVALDLNNNCLQDLPESLGRLDNLKVLLLKNNRLDSNSFPKNFLKLESLEVLNVSGNLLQELPDQILDLPMIKAFYAGGNQLRSLPCKIGDMLSLEVLYLGGNQLREIPATIGKLRNLNSLVLCENRLETIPSTISDLQTLESLSLHSNALTVLPTEIVKIASLQQLSIRSNPLVARFVRDMTFDPPSLKELAGRVIQIRHMEFHPELMPQTLQSYLKSAHQCVNPKCKGVYFEARVEHVKFTDFCGKYRIPLMQYLCSPKCGTHPAYAMTESSAEESDAEVQEMVPKMKKVLLG